MSKNYYQVFISSSSEPYPENVTLKREIKSIVGELKKHDRQWREKCSRIDHTTRKQAETDIDRIQSYALENIGRKFPDAALRVEEYGYI